MAKKLVRKWNPTYKKAWVKVALQNALSKLEYGELSPSSKKVIGDVLAECDIKAREKEEIVK
tara:strand:+ start:10809 stop:10994 length:186 start_codon:yes stop_codon:yes gene_type:complete